MGAVTDMMGRGLISMGYLRSFNSFLSESTLKQTFVTESPEGTVITNVYANEVVLKDTTMAEMVFESLLSAHCGGIA